MKIYNYDSATGAYINDGEADIDPLESQIAGKPVYMIPANATEIAPPVEMPRNTRVFRNGAWGYVLTEAPGEVTDEAHPPSANDVVAERTLRLQTGFSYDFKDDRGQHHIATSDEDMKNWAEVTSLSNALISTGNPDTQIDIMTQTGPTHVSALEWQSVLIRAAAFRQPIFYASFALQAMDPIPEDYKDDKYWPVTENMPPVEQDPNLPPQTEEGQPA